MTPINPYRAALHQVSILLAICLPICGCSHATPQDTQSAQNQTVQTGSPGPFSLTISPSPARQLVPGTFRVAGHPTIPQGTTVFLTLTMPTMAMPPTIIRMVRTEDGSYAGSGSFTMDGDWQAEITATTSGRRTVQKVLVQVR